MTEIRAIEENAPAYYKGTARLLGGYYVEKDRMTWFTTGRRNLFRFNGVHGDINKSYVTERSSDL